MKSKKKRLTRIRFVGLFADVPEGKTKPFIDEMEKFLEKETEGRWLFDWEEEEV